MDRTNDKMKAARIDILTNEKTVFGSNMTKMIIQRLVLLFILTHQRLVLL